MTDYKIKIIDEIVRFHPSAGVDKGWSWYNGGMADTGEWYFRKMMDISIEELCDFLNKLIEENSRPKIPLTPEQQRANAIIHSFENGGWIRELDLKILEKMHKDLESKLLYGDDKSKIH